VLSCQWCQAPYHTNPAFVHREEAFATGTITRTFVVGSIKQWREKEAMPWVDIKEKLGPAGDLDSGTAALLASENVLDQDFSLEVGFIGLSKHCMICHSKVG
jgi:hypothetical protein